MASNDDPAPKSAVLDQDVEWARAAKRALRQKHRALREALPESAALARSARIVERLSQHPRVVAAKSVALFWPIIDRREVDLRPLDEQLRARGVAIYYPFMERASGGEFDTGFRRVAATRDLILSTPRFAQPAANAHVAERGEVDVVVVPALAATPTGSRLGYGSGFYDATLLDLCPPAHSIVVVYDFQLMFELPLEPHDLTCDEVITDRI